MRERGVRLNVEKLRRIAHEKGMKRLSEISEATGVHRSQLWRCSLPISHDQYRSPGGDLISRVTASLDVAFDDVFFLDQKVAK